MSATAKNTNEANYYKIENFSFVKNVKEKTEISKVRVYNEKEYFFEEYKEIKGTLKKIYLNEKESSDGTKKWTEITFSLKDESGTIENISTYFLNHESTEILNRLINCDYKKEILFKIFRTEKTKKDGKKFFITMLCLYQFHINKKLNNKLETILIPKAFIYDQETGSFNHIDGIGTLPLKEVKEVKKVKIYDNSRQMDFFKVVVENINKLI